MTVRPPPNEPLDPHELELARILRALPVGEPPAALDASILRAATNAAAASRRPTARLLASASAMWGIGGAAAAVLALGVALHMRYSPTHAPEMDSAPRAQAVSDMAEDEAVQVELGEVHRQYPAPTSPPPAMSAPPVLDQAAPAKPRARAELRQNASPAMAAAPPPAAPEPFAADALDEHVAREGAINAIDVQAVESTTILTSEQMAKLEAKERDRRADSAKAASAPQSSAAGASAPRAEAESASALGGLAAPQPQASQSLGYQGRVEPAPPKKPATWIAEIRRLRDAGHIEQARARLVEFRRAYPNWVIPTDLAPLLSE